MARERGGVREESRTIPATYAYSHIRQIGANHGKRKAGFWGQLVLGLAGLQKNKNRGRVHPSLSTMHSRMHDLCALLNPISVDSANPVSDHRLFRAREDRGLVPAEFLIFFFSPREREEAFIFSFLFFSFYDSILKEKVHLLHRLEHSNQIQARQFLNVSLRPSTRQQLREKFRILANVLQARRCSETRE